MTEEYSAIAGTRKAVKELVDGTLRIQIDIEPRHKKQFHKLFPDIDMPVAIAPLAPVAEGLGRPVGDSGNLKRYGQQAKELRQSDFFRRPEVWKAVGTDKQFLDWIKQQPCAWDGKQCFADNNPVVPAHVRRVANGAGTGIKPPYSAIPLCFKRHAAQTDHGESEIGGRDWWDKKRIEYVQKWCWETLKAKLGYDSWADVPPWELFNWAEEHGVSAKNGSMTLPRSYYDTYPEETE